MSLIYNDSIYVSVKIQNFVKSLLSATFAFIFSGWSIYVHIHKNTD